MEFTKLKKMRQKNFLLWVQSALMIETYGSPIASAKLLGVSITTIYRHLDALEEAIGFQVFNRQNTGWSVNENAQAFLRACDKIELQLNTIEEEISKVSEFVEGNLRIAVSDDFAVHYMTAHLNGFCERYPDIKPDLIVSSEFADLVNGEADVAIRPDMDPGDSLVGRRVGVMQHAFYASNKYLRNKELPQSVIELNQHQICGYGAALADYTAARWLHKNIKEEAIVAYFDSTIAMSEAVKQGLGIALLPCFVGEKSASLDAIFNIEKGMPIDIWLVSAAINKEKRKVQAFFDYFAACIRSDERLFLGVS